MLVRIIFFSLCLVSAPLFAQKASKLQVKLENQVKTLESQVIEWRRKFHQNPELSNRENQTGAFIAEYLKSLGMEVQYPVARTGVVGLLNTGKPGLVVALRADMDALPITERNGLPFASNVKTTFGGQETG